MSAKATNREAANREAFERRTNYWSRQERHTGDE